MGLAYVGISGMVQHSQYTFECAGWVGATNVRPNRFFVPAGSSTSSLRFGPGLLSWPRSGWSWSPMSHRELR
jgi:hypothetical protein